MSLLSVNEAAEELHLHPSRVRALVSAGQLPAVKVGQRWAIESAEVARRQRDPRPPGRPFEVDNAWAILFLSSGDEVPWIERGIRWRLEQGLAFRGLAGLRPRLGRRADVHRFHAHPGELRYVSERGELAKSGISAVGHYELGLVAGGELDAYLPASALKGVCRDHALEPAGTGRANVVLRAAPDSAWHLDGHGGIAPIAAVALDLAEDPDSRSSRTGKDLIKRLDRDRRAS